MECSALWPGTLPGRMNATPTPAMLGRSFLGPAEGAAGSPDAGSQQNKLLYSLINH
uniref:Uncharacterized protein n=1 Tax=Pseudomonas putida TaxID=303 RepID=A0A6B7PWN0_PSEPU|nr:hypothetical protein [Pseudomonas putida]